MLALLGENGHIAESYRYDGFGRTRVFDGNGTELAVSAVGNPFGFACKRYDPTTALCHFGVRWHDPAVGRVISPDPLGFVDGPNRYAYCAGDPVNSVDPWGLKTLEELTSEQRARVYEIWRQAMHLTLEEGHEHGAVLYERQRDGAIGVDMLHGVGAHDIDLQGGIIPRAKTEKQGAVPVIMFHCHTPNGATGPSPRDRDRSAVCNAWAENNDVDVYWIGPRSAVGAGAETNLAVITILHLVVPEGEPHGPRLKEEPAKPRPWIDMCPDSAELVEEVLRQSSRKLSADRLEAIRRAEGRRLGLESPECRKGAGD